MANSKGITTANAILIRLRGGGCNPYALVKDHDFYTAKFYADRGTEASLSAGIRRAIPGAIVTACVLKNHAEPLSPVYEITFKLGEVPHLRAVA